MFWTAGLVLVALAFSQVPAELAEPVFIEDAIAGAPSTADNRIVSGWEARPGEQPHQVSLRLVDGGGGVSGCGGSVVHTDWILTAAHCTALRITAVVRAGSVNLTTPEYIFETTEWYNHPTYDDNRPAVVQPNDISILKLQQPVVYTDNLQRIRIQPSSDAFLSYNNEVFTASGWGRTWTDGAQPEVLQWVYLRAVTNQVCAQTFGTALINENAICARWFNVVSQSTCQGDSGGPLVHERVHRQPVLVGIASFVAGGQWGCHSGLPAGFIRPGPFLGWLNEVTGIDFENLSDEDFVIEPPQTTAGPRPTLPPPTQPPTTTTEPPTTTTEPPTTVTEPPTTSSEPATTDTEAPSTRPPSPKPEPESDEDSDSSESEEDPEITELLKKLIVKVKVKVKINDDVKRKLKLMSVDKF